MPVNGSFAPRAALRRQRSHLRIVSGAPFVSYCTSAICARGLKLRLWAVKQLTVAPELCSRRVGVIDAISELEE